MWVTIAVMHDSSHICYEGGAIDLGYSKLAVGLLSMDNTLPGPATRKRIAEDLLSEAAKDGALANIWNHAGRLSVSADHPEALPDFLQDHDKA